MTTDREQFEKALQVVRELCDGTRRWVMCVPARPDDDPDLVIAGALQRGLDVAVELAALRSENERLRADLDALARVAGEAILEATLAPGESVALPSDHALTRSMRELRSRAERAEAENERLTQAFGTLQVEAAGLHLKMYRVGPVNENPASWAWVSAHQLELIPEESAPEADVAKWRQRYLGVEAIQPTSEPEPPAFKVGDRVRLKMDPNRVTPWTVTEPPPRVGRFAKAPVDAVFLTDRETRGLLGFVDWVLPSDLELVPEEPAPEAAIRLPLQVEPTHDGRWTVCHLRTDRGEEADWYFYATCDHRETAEKIVKAITDGVEAQVELAKWKQRCFDEEADARAAKAEIERLEAVNLSLRAELGDARRDAERAEQRAKANAEQHAALQRKMEDAKAQRDRMRRALLIAASDLALYSGRPMGGSRANLARDLADEPNAEEVDRG